MDCCVPEISMIKDSGNLTGGQEHIFVDNFKVYVILE